MKCAWNEFLAVLPARMRLQIDQHGRDRLQELRLRTGLPPELILNSRTICLNGPVQKEELLFCINAASRYSPWAAESMAEGYITAPGGHRIGMCGEAIVKNGVMAGVKNVSSLCIRVARDFPDLAAGIPCSGESILILGRPGSGKTTLLRDLIRRCSDYGTGSVAVVDERGELFPSCACFPSGKRTDVLTGCSKGAGIDMVLRTMGPACIAVDEITAESDTTALLHAGWCGVSLLATAHAANVKDLKSRPVYRPIVENQLFDKIVVLQADKSWKMERMNGL